jgi:hypothetical protein
MKWFFAFVFPPLVLMKKSLLLLLALASTSFAADPTPVAQWAFDGDKADIGKVEGGVVFQQDGPSSKQFKHIPASNKAARFEGAKGSFIRVTDPGEKSLLISTMATRSP